MTCTTLTKRKTMLMMVLFNRSGILRYSQSKEKSKICFHFGTSNLEAGENPKF